MIMNPNVNNLNGKPGVLVQGSFNNICSAGISALIEKVAQMGLLVSYLLCFCLSLDVCFGF